jgi:hypothetical protein
MLRAFRVPNITRRDFRGFSSENSVVKINVSELSPPASEEHMAIRQERQSPSQSRPLDLSFHCEGGSCSLASEARHTVKTKPNLSLLRSVWPC